MDLFETCRGYLEPAFARMAGIYPFFHPLEGSEGPVVTYLGNEVVMMGSNNYLGLTHHPRVVAAAQAALEASGAGATASRLLSGTRPEHAALEEDLARFKGSRGELIGLLQGVQERLGYLPQRAMLRIARFAGVPEIGRAHV